MRPALLVITAVLVVAQSASVLACKKSYPVTRSGTVKFEYVVCALAGQSVQLMDEVRKEFKRQSVNAKDVTCTSVSLGRKFDRVGKIRIPPFNCEVGGKYLLINGDVMTYDVDAKAGPSPDNTRHLVIANPKWSWH